MTVYNPDQQLQDELENTFVRCLRSKRPILTHLNADTSWLLQIPCRPTSDGRFFFNILIDPWFKGTQSDVAHFFSIQEHLIASSVQTIEELDSNLREIQRIAERALGHGKSRRLGLEPVSYIDAVVISHEFTDHCTCFQSCKSGLMYAGHKATLLELDPSVPVFATDKAADLIRSWKYFQTVVTTPAFAADDPDWRKTSVNPLPEYIGISRIVTVGNQLYYHSAVMITFASGAEDDAAETVIYSPHGIVANDLQHLTIASPPVRTLALLHGLHDVGITWTKQLNLGGHNGLRAQRICKAKYWVGTHDEIKKPGGLIAPFLRRTVVSVKQALAMEQVGYTAPEVPVELEKVHFSDLQSGESLLLE